MNFILVSAFLFSFAGMAQDIGRSVEEYVATDRSRAEAFWSGLFTEKQRREALEAGRRAYPSLSECVRTLIFVDQLESSLGRQCAETAHEEGHLGPNYGDTWANWAIEQVHLASPRDPSSLEEKMRQRLLAAVMRSDADVVAVQYSYLADQNPGDLFESPVISLITRREFGVLCARPNTIEGRRIKTRVNRESPRSKSRYTPIRSVKE